MRWLLLLLAALGPALAQRLHPALDLRPVNEAAAGERGLLAVDERRLDEDKDQGDGDDQVLDLPGLDPTAKVEHSAGRIALDDGGKDQLFYWHFPAAKDPDTAPLVIWCVLEELVAGILRG